jgi:signal transduction histidine kinase
MCAPRYRTLTPALLATAAIPLGIAAYRIQTHDLYSPSDKAGATVSFGWAFVLAGAVAWSRRPENRVGPLMLASGYALLARQLRYSHDTLLFTLFFALGDLGYALVGHTALAYPFGRVRDRAERGLVIAGYATALVFPLAILLVDSHTPLFFPDPSPRRSLVLVAADAHLVDILQKVFVVVLYLLLGSLFLALIVRRLVQAAPRMRRILAPLLLAAIAITLRAVSEGVFTFISRPFAYDYLFWWQIGAFIALPLALLAGLLQARLQRANVGDLVVELEHTSVQGLRDALARALGDPQLEVAFWLPEQRVYADIAGALVELPSDDARRTVTHLNHAGEPLAAIIHDSSLREEPKLVQAAGAAARLAIENARLHADTRAQLVQVQESRIRIVEAADEARRRIERDLHDGAQQRLVALALQLRSGQRQVGGRDDREVDRLLAAAADELQSAIDELRELARGVHPAILTEEGLAAALESLVHRSSLPLSLDVSEERLPAQAEATAYFVACEALTNIAKHAQATNVSISARRRNGTLVLEVTDDGTGGARIENGTGLRGLNDRVEAVGGRLTILSPPGGGTQIVAEIPCVS